MNEDRIVSGSSVSAERPTSLRDLRFLIVLGVPLVFLAACGSGQTTSATGTGGAGGTTVGTGGAGGTGGGAGKAGSSGAGGNGVGGKVGTGGSSSGGVGGGGTGGGAAGAGGHGGASTGDMGGAGGGSSCAIAASGAACTAEGATCGGPCTDVCQFCNLLRCTGGHWQSMEAAPAPCFSCGDGKCQTMSQYCRTTEGGAAGAVPTHACVNIPTECLSMRTCACLASQATAGQCTMGSNGELMTLLQVP